MNRRAFINKGWAWTGLLLVPPTIRALPPLITAAVDCPRNMPPSSTSGVPTSGLLARYPLTQTAQLTETVSGLNGTPHNGFGGTTVSDHNGVANGAIKVVALGTEYATIPNFLTPDWSMGMWLKPDTLASAAFNRIIGQASYLNDLAFNDPSALGYNILRAYDGAWQFVGNSAHWTIGDWNHLGLTYSSTGPTGEFYFNGVPTNSETYTNLSMPITLGCDYTASNPGNFSISEWIFYNRKLSDAEMLQVYQNT